MPSQTTGSTAINEIERLVALKEQGLLSDEEFERAKHLTVERDTNQPSIAAPLQELQPEPEPVSIQAPEADISSPSPVKLTADQVIGDSNKYGTALMLGNLISIIGWFVVIVGFIGTAMSSSGIAILAALSISILGIVVVASGQLIGAAVDVANNSAGLLALEKAKWDKENG